MFRAVLDTNVIVSGKRSKHPRSPSAEILDRWAKKDFVWLISPDHLTEYAEKLIEFGAARVAVEQFIFEVISMAESVPIRFFHIHRYPADSDDTVFLLTALNGRATHLVTYDDHLVQVGWQYPEFKTCPPLIFLADLRKPLP